MATLIPQHDDEGRSATILPGVPLPEWALPAGPIAPEPDPTDMAPPAAPVETPAPVQELVMAGAPASVADAVAETAPASPYAPPLPIGTNGPGPMRAGWDYPGSDFREQAHDEALAEAADEAAQAADAPAEAPLDPALALALTAPVPKLEPLQAPEPVGAPVADLPAPVEADTAGTASADAPVEPGAEVAAEDTEKDDTEGPAPSSRRGLIVLGAVGAVAVAGAVAAFVWPGFLVSAEPAPAPVVPPISAPAPVDPVTLTTPSSVGPYTKLDGAPASALTQAVTGSTLPGLTGPVSAVYGTGTTPAVTVIAWSSATPLGASAIPSAFAGFQGATSAVVTGITTTPVSSGGELQCGTTVVSGEPASLCFWADEATFGSVTVLTPVSAESAADTATAVRAAVVGG